jgi:hypothetical protein
MRMRNGTITGPAMAGAAATGLLAGHVLTYLVVRPDAQARSALLAHTGHGYLSTAAEVAVLLAIMGCASVLTRAARAASGGEPAAPRVRDLAARLALLQCGAFVAMEVSERLASGSPVLVASTLWILGLGLALQVAIATVGATVLRWLTRAAEWIVVRLRRAPMPRAAASWPAPPETPIRGTAALRGGRRVRAPPPLRFA